MRCQAIRNPVAVRDAVPVKQDFMYDKRLQTMDDDMDAILDSIDPILFYQASNQRQQRK